MIILAIILPPVLFWTVVISWISYRERKSRRERTRPTATSTGTNKRQPLFSKNKNSKK